MRPIASRLLAVVVAAALLSPLACSNDSSGPTDAQSRIAFTVTGSRSATFQVRGDPKLEGTALDFDAWVSAYRDTLGGLVITAFRPDSGTYGDLFVLQLRSAQEGTYTCHAISAAPCRGRIIFGVNTANYAEHDAFYELSSGTMTVSELSTERLRGTFSILLRDDEGAGENSIRLEGGTFDASWTRGATVAAVECTITRAVTRTNGSC